MHGVRVLDLSRLVAGNTLTQVLADFGAEVIKVEPPAGDTLRAWKTRDVETNWRIYARNKKSLALELRNPAARALLLELVATAQVFIESFRPDTLEKMGLGTRDAAGEEPEARHRAHFRLGPDGAVSPAARVRHPGGRACRVSLRSTDSPTASRCFRRCTSPIRPPASTAPRAC